MAEPSAQHLNIYLLTYNCGRSLIQPDVFGPYFFDALSSQQNSPDILVLSLQEVAPIGYAFLGGSFLTPYFNAFRQVVRLAKSDVLYTNLVTRNVGMTAIMVFVKEDLVPQINRIESAGVGVGLQDMGNKGAVGTRMGYQLRDTEMELTFVSAHLAPMEDALERRNEDYKKIVGNLVFTSTKPRHKVATDEQAEDAPLLQGTSQNPSSGTKGLYHPSSHLFFSGDLNYRTALKAPTAEDISSNFPQPTPDPKDPHHFSHLLSHDQLTTQLKLGKTLHGLIEAPITFPPTYKYRQDSGNPVKLDKSASHWNWASHRWPSWCDRILYLDLPQHTDSAGAQIKIQNYTALPLFCTSDHRPVALCLSLPTIALAPEPTDRNSTSNDIRHNPPFPINPNWRADRDVARRKELLVGILAYLTLTNEGRGLLIATVLGVVGGWYVVFAILSG